MFSDIALSDMKDAFLFILYINCYYRIEAFKNYKRNACGFDLNISLEDKSWL